MERKHHAEMNRQSHAETRRRGEFQQALGHERNEEQFFGNKRSETCTACREELQVGAQLIRKRIERLTVPVKRLAVLRASAPPREKNTTALFSSGASAPSHEKQASGLPTVRASASTPSLQLPRLAQKSPARTPRCIFKGCRLLPSSCTQASRKASRNLVSLGQRRFRLTPYLRPSKGEMYWPAP